MQQQLQQSSQPNGNPSRLTSPHLMLNELSWTEILWSDRKKSSTFLHIRHGALTSPHPDAATPHCDNRARWILFCHLRDGTKAANWPHSCLQHLSFSLLPLSLSLVHYGGYAGLGYKTFYDGELKILQGVSFNSGKCVNSGSFHRTAM